MGALEFCAPSLLMMGRKLENFGPKRASAASEFLHRFRSARLSQVLLVDDNPVQLQIRETILRNAGFAVAIATSAEGALVLLRTAGHHFGLVITDHIMPGASGADFVRRLRASGDHIPVIVLSGLLDAEMEYEGLNVAFRLKPLPPAELIELVREWMKGQNAA
jgi:CheY-like chemotaxis protein